jgi:transcriptional regulator with XRE-family HTH domain
MTRLQDLGDDAVLKALGERIARRRIDRDYTQRQLADRSGVGRSAIQRLEAGETVNSLILIRVLRALDVLDELDAGIPELGPSPVQVLRSEGRVRQRATGQWAKSAPPPRTGEFRWGKNR